MTSAVPAKEFDHVFAAMSRIADQTLADGIDGEIQPFEGGVAR